MKKSGKHRRLNRKNLTWTIRFNRWQEILEKRFPRSMRPKQLFKAAPKAGVGAAVCAVHDELAETRVAPQRGESPER